MRRGMLYLAERIDLAARLVRRNSLLAPMKNLVRTTFFLATLFLSLAAVARAQGGGPCSATAVAGNWAYSYTGTIGTAPVAAVGNGTLDRNGNWSGTQTSSLSGLISSDTLSGTVTVNSDCTGTLTVTVTPASGPVRVATLAVVFDDSQREFRGIFTTLTQGGSNVTGLVIIQNGRKLLPG